MSSGSMQLTQMLPFNPWGLSHGDKAGMDPVALAKSRQSSPALFSQQPKRKCPTTHSPEPTSPSSAHATKKRKHLHSAALPPASFIAPTESVLHKADSGMTPDAASPLPHPARDGAAGDLQTPQMKVEPSSAKNAIGAATGQDRLEVQPAVPNIDTSTSTTGTSCNTTMSASGEPETTASADISQRHPELRQVIEFQINQEILHRHNELRLIEQELAKCQVALEQLRRCQVIPYPGHDLPSLDVSGGVGHAVQPPAGYTQPPYAAPFGVTDGPYTRHLATWLLPDPAFDSVSRASLANNVEGRATRASFADPLGYAQRGSRSVPGRAKTLVSEPATPAQPARDPLVLKRSSDGKWVKLWCEACNQEKFQNIQGFINHCRIKHKISYQSHDAAAIACGRPVDVDESYNFPVAKPDTKAAAKAHTDERVPVSDRPLVSPLITDTPGSQQPAKRAPHISPRSYPPLSTTSSASGVPPADQQHSGYTPSPQTPYLSSLAQARGLGVNLDKAVTEAKEKVNLDIFDPSSDEEHPEGKPAKKRAKSSKPRTQVPSRQPVQAAGMTPTPPDRPTSRRDERPPTIRLFGLQAANARDHPQDHSQRGLPSEGMSAHGMAPQRILSDSMDIDLSPHTLDSNPGLVSDREGDDEDDAHSEAISHRGDYVMDDAIVVEDGSDTEKRMAFQAGPSCK